MITLFQTGGGLERAMGRLPFLWMTVAVGLLQPGLMLALAHWGRRRPDIVPAILRRNERAVGLSGVIFAMLAVHQWTGVAGPSSYVGIAGYVRIGSCVISILFYFTLLYYDYYCGGVNLSLVTSHTPTHSIAHWPARGRGWPALIPGPACG